VLSQVEWGTTAFRLELLDLSRRRVTYRQDKPGGLDWSKAATSLAEVTPGIIDVKSLENRKHSAQFFLDEVGRNIGAAKEPAPRRVPVVIILSGSVEFEPGQEMHPIASDTSLDARVFYIRYQPLPSISFGPAVGARQRGRMPREGFPARGFSPPIDQLESLLKPLEPQLFEVATAEQFRKALATILAGIAKL
jgi:hypothetical protein